MKSWICILTIGTMLNSCCTKEDCATVANNIIAPIKVSGKKFGYAYYFYLIDKNGNIFGAKNIDLNNNIGKINILVDKGVTINIRNDSLNISDSIVVHDYDITTSSFECNDCFLIPNKMETSESYSNFTLEHQNKIITENDTIYIN